MGAKNYAGVRKLVRNGKTRYAIDFRYRDATGKPARYQRDAAVQTHAAAHAEAKRLMLRASETGSPIEIAVAPKAGMLTFSEFVAAKFEVDFFPTYRPATAIRYRALLKQTVLPEFGKRALNEITSADYRTYAAKLLRAGVTVKGPLTMVRTVLRAAEVSGLIEVAPTVPKGLIKQSRKLPAAPSAEEVTAMLTARGWVRTAIFVSALAGLRAGEVRALEVQDVDFVNNAINVRRACSGDAADAESLTPKSGHERIVPMDVTLAAHLKEVVKGKLPRARVVITSAGMTPRRQELLRAYKRALGALDLKSWSFHALRHYFCSALVRHGVGLEAVRQLAGHSSLSVTSRYAHATGDDLRAAVLRLHG